MAEVKNSWNYTSGPPLALWPVQGQVYFTFIILETL